MSLKLIAFVIAFLFLVIGALINPIWGIIGYMAHYIVGFERQWWHAPLSSFGIRYSLLFSLVIVAGSILNKHKLRFNKLFHSQELIALGMLLLMWFVYLLGPETVNRYMFTDHPTEKITKVMIFCLLMTHIATRSKDIDRIFWLFVIGALILGLQAYGLPRSAFTGGRLDSRVGGSDFLEANALAAFMVAATTIVGTVFMRSSWMGKLLCSVAAVFALNTIVLCRSRGAILALAGAGLTIILTAPRHLRIRLVAGLLAALVGLVWLSDEQFVDRIANISSHADAVMAGAEAEDRSTMMRVEAWRGGMQMFRDHPLGVGPGNFNQLIGQYSPSVEGLSPHSTYIQALTELGILGLGFLLVLMANSLLIIRKVVTTSHLLPEPERSVIQWSSCGIGAVIIGYAACGVTGHFLYFEAFWWFLLLPVCLQRASENALEDSRLPVTEATPEDAPASTVSPG